MKLRYKLLIAFFITTSLTGVSTTIFAIHYFSSVIQQEAIDNMEKYTKVAYLVYNSQLDELKNFTLSIASNRGFQLFTQLKITDKLVQILRAQSQDFKNYHIQVFDVNHFRIAENGLESNIILQTQLAELDPTPLLKKSFKSTDALASIESLQLGRNTILTLSAATPIFDNANRVGTLLVRYILHDAPEFNIALERMLGIKVSLQSYQAAENTFSIEKNKENPMPAIGWLNTKFNQQLALDEYLSYNYPLLDIEQDIVAQLGIHIRTEQYAIAIKNAIINLVSLMALCITVTFILAYLMAHSILKPLRQLLLGVEGVGTHDFLNSAQQLANGAWHHALPIERSDELGKLAKAFSLMAQHLQHSFMAVEGRNQELQQLNQLKDEFLANTSHELKTPIQGIVGLAESLLENKNLIDNQRNALLTIIHSGYRLANLVNDILDFSRLRHRDIILNQQAVNVRSLVDIVIILSRPLVDQKPVLLNNVVSDDLPLVYADENRLQQILHNLIGNAIKFTERGDVTISAKVRPQSQDLVIKIRDSGIGIASEALERIFEAFEQGNGSSARLYGGTGLGLAISRRLVELHGGKIWVKSNLNEGTSFYFSLPLADQQAINAPSSSPRPALRPANSLALSNLAETTSPATSPSVPTITSSNVTVPSAVAHVLVVDDEPLNRQILVNHLCSHHYRVTEANSGKRALQLLLQENLVVDLVLLDVMMPSMTGYEVTEQLRQHWRADELPIVLLTAKTQIKDVVLGLEIGANDYLTKPVSREELLARLKTHLYLRELRHETQRLELRQAQFLEAMPMGVKILEANGQSYFHNKHATALGVDFPVPTNGDVISNLYQSNSDHLYPVADLPIAQALQGESAYADDLVIQHPDYSIALECWAAPVFENGEVRYVIAAFQEITARKSAEAELRSSETRFRQLMEAMTAAVVIVQADGYLLYANHATEELTGYSLAKLQRLPLWNLVHPDYQQSVIERGRMRLDGHMMPARYELPILNYQQHTRWLDVTARRIEHQGQPALIINALDITERKTTTELLNNIAAGLISSTGKNFLLSLVEYLANTLQVDCVFIGQYVSTDYGDQMMVDFISTKHIEQYLEKFTYSLQGTPSYQVVTQRCLFTYERNVWQQFPKDPLLQSLKAECFMGTPLLTAEGNLQGLMAIINCQPLENCALHESALQIFAARAAAELERQAALETLEAERVSLAEHIQERTSELSRANAELARAARLKDEFLANMSHELRTPLNAILGLSEGLLEGVFGEINSRQQRSLSVLSESGRHLLELINDILDLAKIEANKIQLNLDAVSLKELCEASLRLIQEMANKKRISLHSEFDSAIGNIIADSRRLKQILVNLLSNAVKFTLENGDVWLKIQAHEDTQQVSICIQDNGIGIREADIPRLFRPFEQLDGGLDRAHEGTGLGLALVQRLVMMHNGYIHVNSTLNQGSLFTIYLPWQKIEATHKPVARTPNLNKPTPPFSDLNATKLLLVDDNPVNIKTFDEYLRAVGYSVELAGDGVEALEKVCKVKPDLILMDIQMPRMDGLTACQKLREHAETRDIPVIALTALAMPGDKEKCLAAGATAYLSKPVRLPDLVTLIGELLQQKKTTPDKTE